VDDLRDGADLVRVVVDEESLPAVARRHEVEAARPLLAGRVEGRLPPGFLTGSAASAIIGWGGVGGSMVIPGSVSTVTVMPVGVAEPALDEAETA
jgi:hypothetical protein